MGEMPIRELNMINMQRVYLDYMVCVPGAYNNKIIAMSYFARSLTEVRGFGANLLNGYVPTMAGMRFQSVGKSRYNVFFSKVPMSRESCYHGFAKLMDDEDGYVITTVENASTDLFNFLMNKFTLPLMVEWKDVLLEYFHKMGIIKVHERCVITDDSCQEIPGFGSPASVRVIEIPKDFDEETFKDTLSGMIKNKIVTIAPEEQLPIEVDSLDSYYAKYGEMQVEAVKKKLTPLYTDVDGTTDHLAFAEHRLFFKQADTVNGITACLHKHPYCILNMGMGTGKTKCSIGAVEQFYVEKYLRRNPHKTLEDVYLHPDCINYRAVIMAPGQLLKKWRDEILTELPMANVYIVDTFEKLLEIKKMGSKRRGREFIIFSKDFAKLGSINAPKTSKLSRRYVYEHICRNCGKEKVGVGNVPCENCGETDWVLEKHPNRQHLEEGMICPDCGQILMPNVQKLKVSPSGETVHYPLTPKDFKAPNKTNEKCYYCGASLWGPQTKNIGKVKDKKWHRYSHFANAAKKTTKSVWLFEGHEMDYIQTLDPHIAQSLDDFKKGIDEGCRKYTPATFIKRYMKGYFDLVILDEVHKYKGETGQGNAMGALIKASKKCLALTGTLAGGYAKDIFYLLYRLNPTLMKKEGFEYSDIQKFSELYGCSKEITYANKGNDDYSVSVKSKGQTRVQDEPGISPLVVSKFLLPYTVYLDIEDMSDQLPPLHEYVEVVDVESDILGGYNKVINDLKKCNEAKMKLASAMLQFALTYPDHSYDIPDILNPKDGRLAAAVPSCDIYRQTITNKERRLCEIVEKELSEGRNCVVYLEATGDSPASVLGRIAGVLEREVDGLEGKVATIVSASPKASEREEYLHKLAEQGKRVIVCNPALVETGLDFRFDYHGKTYNYPTLIFYQMGYSLFTLWQASCRHYRLNQTEECRTYYIAYENTLQMSVIKLMAAKKNAVAAMQGKFSADGLAAMSAGVDTQAALVNALVKGIEDSSEVKEMFATINKANDIGTKKEAFFYSMPLIKELIGEDAANMICKHHEPDMPGDEDMNLFTYLAQTESVKADEANESAGKTATVTKTEAVAETKKPARRKRRTLDDIAFDTDEFKEVGGLFTVLADVSLSVAEKSAGRRVAAGQLTFSF